MKLFKLTLAQILSQKRSKMTDSIMNLTESQVLSYDQRLIDDIYNKYKMNKSLEIKELIDSDIVMAKDYSRRSYSGDFYEYAVVTYIYKFEGDKTLLDYRPMNFINAVNDVEFNNDTMTLFISTNYGNRNLPDHYISDAKNKRENMINNIKSNIKNLTEEIEDFNKKLASEIEELLEKRKAEIESHNEIKKKLM